MPATHRWVAMTPYLAFSCFSLLVGDMLFGYDTGSFGGVLANPGFIAQFGDRSATGTYAISALHTSLLSSLAFIGKFVGCLAAGPLIERFGHRLVFYMLSVASFVGVIIEMTSAGTEPGSGRLAQFIVGRIFVYLSVGLVEVAATTYQSEIVPAPLRGLVVISLQLFLTAGTLLATGVNRAFSTYTTSVGWRVVTGLQFIFPLLIISFTPFIPDSPRWLLSKNRDSDALDSLRKLRPANDVTEGRCELELSAIQDALAAHIHKESYFSLFKGTNTRRTLIVLVGYTFQQITGQAFVSTYQTVFYKSNGYAAQAFTYPIVSTSMGLFTTLLAMYLVDMMGRRNMFMLSCALQSLWMFLLAGIGSLTKKTERQSNAVVAFFMLYSLCYNFGGASIPYVLGAEIPAHAVREKTQAVGAGLNVVWAFATNFAIPYMLAALSFKVGYIFGGIAALALVWAFLFLPETKGLALEEIDDVFSTTFNPFKPKPRHVSNAAALVGTIEREDKPEEKQLEYGA